MRQIAGPDPSPATTKPKVNRDLDIRALEVLFDIGLDKAALCGSTSIYPTVTSPMSLHWTQPGGSIRLEGGTSIGNLDVYPNPSRDIFNISFTSEEKQNLRVSFNPNLTKMYFFM